MSEQKYLSPEIIQKIRHIEIYTKRLLRGSLTGNYVTRQKGFGLEFDQIREYQQGDDVRFIDWKSTARSGKMLVKQYYQEYSRTIWLVVDISASVEFTSDILSKRDVIAHVASVLSIVADFSKDMVGLILFSDEVEYVLPPRRGKAHTHEIMKQLFSYAARESTTNIQAACKYLMQKRSKEAIVFLISDFIDNSYEKVLPFLTRWFDCIAIRYLDILERAFPCIGMLRIEDIETGQVVDVDKEGQKDLAKIIDEHSKQQNMIFKKYGIDYIDIKSLNSLVHDLVCFFQKRLY